MQCEPSTSVHWKDCACNQACRTRSCTRTCTMARPHRTKCRPKGRAECLQGNWKHRGRKESCWWRRQSRGTSVWSRGQIKGWSKGSRPQITSAKGLRQQVPQATQAHHHLLQPAPQRPNLHQSRCQRRQNHLGLLPQTNHNQHLSTRRNALIDMTFFFRTGNAQRAPGTDDAWAPCGVLHLHWWISQRLTGERTLSEA